MTETTFQPGDRVKCIWGAGRSLIEGNEYVVERTRGLMVKLEGHEDYQLWDPSRFEKVEEPEDNDVTREGDTVECVDASPGVFGRTLTLGRHYRVARSTVYVRDDGGGERGFSSSRFRKVAPEGARPLSQAALDTVQNGENIQVSLRTGNPEPGGLQAELAKAHETITRVRDRLIQEAEKRGWCEEFDQIMEEVGLEPRRQPKLVRFMVAVREPANSLSVRHALENHNFYVESVERQ